MSEVTWVYSTQIVRSVCQTFVLLFFLLIPICHLPSLTSHRDSLVHRSVSHLLFVEGSRQDRRCCPPAGGEAADPDATQTRAGAETTFDLSAECPRYDYFKLGAFDSFAARQWNSPVLFFFSCDFRWLWRRADRKCTPPLITVLFQISGKEKKKEAFMETLWTDGLLLWVNTGMMLERTFENHQFVQHKFPLHNPARESSSLLFMISESTNLWEHDQYFTISSGLTGDSCFTHQGLW